MGNETIVEIEITNPNRAKKWGVAFNNHPGSNGDIDVPDKPEFTGTIRQVLGYSSEQCHFYGHTLNCYYASKMFYNKKPIRSIRTIVLVKHGETASKNEYDYRWVRFETELLARELETGKPLQLRLVDENEQ